MDSKALAKSKRAHSQHHNKKYQKPKPPSAAAAPKKALGKQIPTNWDRYEEDEEEQEEPTPGSASDVVLPKTKGADYTHLIAEAHSQSQSQLDDVLSGEWNRGVMSMFSARGDSILSWTEDDHFFVNDKTATAHNEVSFLSLNLHSLAEQLEKVDLSQRLFIEADLLPPELNADGLESTSSQSADQVQATFVDKGARVASEESTYDEFPDKIDVVGHDIEIMISSSPASGCLDPKSTSLAQVDDVDPSNIGKPTNQRKPPGSNTNPSVNPLADVLNKNIAAFEAATAEEELDMLLDSFSETKINESSGFRFVQTDASVPPLQLPREGTDLSMLMAVDLDDALDDLINETSIPIHQSGPSHPQEKMTSQSSSHTGSKSKEVDDFDSWFNQL